MQFKIASRGGGDGNGDGALKVLEIILSSHNNIKI